MTPLPTTIRVEDAGATERTITLSGVWRRDLRTALLYEHGDCEDESCDIREAFAEGYVLVAASLLSGATETPVLDAVRHAYEDADAIPEGEGYADMAATPDWEGWSAHFDEFARNCEACGSYTWAHSNYEPERCASCGASLMRDYAFVAVHHVRTNRAPDAAFESLTADLDDGTQDMPLFISGAYRLTEDMVGDPDYDVTLRYAGREVEREDETR